MVIFFSESDDRFFDMNLSYDYQGEKMNSKQCVWVVLLLVLAGCTASINVEKGNELYQSKNYIKAAEHYERAILESPGTSDQSDAKERLENTKILITNDVVAKYGYASLADKEDMQRIDIQIDKIKEVLKWDDRKQRMKLEIDRLNEIKDGIVMTMKSKDEEFNQLIKTVNQNIAVFKLDNARKTFKQALEIGTKSTQTDHYNDIIAKLTNIINEYNHNLSTGNADKVISNLTAYKDLSPLPVELNHIPNKDVLITLLDNEINRLITDNKWIRARQKLSLIHMPELDEKISFIKVTGSNYYHKKAKLAFNSSQISLAYLYAVQSSILDESNFNNSLILRDSQDFVDRSIHRNIAISTFESPSTDIDVGRQFSDSLISQLYKTLPYGVSILEREKIDIAIKEQQKGANAANNIQNADLIITGTVSLFKVESTIDKRNSSAKVTVGEDIAENPEFAQMAKILGLDTNKWPSIPPKVIKTPRYEIVNYTKGTVKIKGFAKAAVRVFDTQKGTIEFIREFNTNVEYTSDFQDEIKDAGIESIPLKLPSETEAKESLRSDLVKQIATVVNKLFENQETQFYNLANLSIDRQEITSSYTPLAQCYFYCMKENLFKTKPVCGKIDELIRQVIE
jgi:tetratricopeptide (TPR) repeat protein